MPLLRLKSISQAQLRVYSRRTQDCSGRKETESLCRKVTSIFHQIASKSLPRKKKSNFRSKNRWFDSECRASKRKSRTSTILYSQDPTNDEKRSQYRADRNAHKALINKKKPDFEKYTKRQNKRLYACFVDYAKAFDSVVRESHVQHVY